jgi:hypothetical protein
VQVAVEEIASHLYHNSNNNHSNFRDLIIVALPSYNPVSHRYTNPIDLLPQCICLVEVLPEWNQCITVIRLIRVAAVAVTLQLLRPICSILLSNQLHLNNSNKDKE